MNFDSEQRKRLTGYLLGRLPEAENEKIEQACLSNPMLTEEIWEIWDELVDAYLRKELSAADQLRVARRIETSPYLRERLKENQAFLSTLERENTGRRPAPQRRAPEAGFAKIWTGRGCRLLLAAAVILFFVYLRNWRSDEEPGPTPVPAPTADLSSRPPASEPGEPLAPAASPATPATPSALPAFFLPYNVVRGDEPLPAIRLGVAPNTPSILLQVEVPLTDRLLYRVALTTSAGTELQTWDRLSTRTLRSIPVLLLQLSLDNLADGSYLLTVTPLSPSPLSINYPFLLERSPGS